MGASGLLRSKYRVVPSMKVLTHSPLPSRVMLMSTGSGILAGSPMVPTSLACQSPLTSLTSQSLEVSAAAVMAQLSPDLSDQRISSGAPGTLKTFLGFMALRSHITIVLPNFFIASASFTRSPSGRM